MKDAQDAFGRALDACMRGEDVFELIERSDGLLETASPIASYFNSYADWSPVARRAADAAHGRVLDIGCGAGRFSLYLQERGQFVVAIDRSPLAIDVCKRRGVKDARVMSITSITKALGRFDTILMMGNNFGLVGSRQRARFLLRRFRGITIPGGRIIAQILDPSDTTAPVHLAYQMDNRRRGRMSGQIRIRVRYRQYKTPWFDYLFVTSAELEDLLKDTGWEIAEVLGREAPLYVVSLALAE